MKTVTLMYFAQLGAQAGCTEEQVKSGAATVAELFTELKGIHGWTLPAEKIRFARNDSFCSAKESFNDGDAVAIMPPMSGG